MAVSAPKSSQTASAVGAADAAREMMIGRSPVIAGSVVVFESSTFTALLLVSLKRPSDGFSWGTRQGEAVD